MPFVSDILAIGKEVAPDLKNAAQTIAKNEINKGINNLLNDINRETDRLLVKAGLKQPKRAEAKSSVRPGSVLQRALERPDPLLQWQFYVDMPVISGYILPDIYVENISFNLPSFNTDDYLRGAKSKHIATEEDTSAISMQVYEDAALTATTYFLAWKTLIKDPATRLYNYPKTYKQDITIRVKGLNDADLALFIISGAFVTNINSNQYNFGSDPSERITVNAELSIDDIWFQPLGAISQLPGRSVLSSLPKQSTDIKTELLRASGLIDAANSIAGRARNAAIGAVEAISGSVTRGINKL